MRQKKTFFATHVPLGELDLSLIDESPLDQILQEQLVSLPSVESLPPVVIADCRLVDGQHRILAAKLRGEERIRYIDLTGLIDTESCGYICEIDWPQVTTELAP